MMIICHKYPRHPPLSAEIASHARNSLNLATTMTFDL